MIILDPIGFFYDGGFFLRKRVFDECPFCLRLYFGCIPLTVFCLSAFCLLIALRGFSMGGPTGFFVSQGSHLEIAIESKFWYKWVNFRSD
jgi:hypothetical protein